MAGWSPELRERWTTARGWRPTTRRARAVSVTVVMVVAAVGAWAVVGRSHDRSVEATVRAFFDARHDGDCEALLDLVSQASRSAGGQSTRDGFVGSCGDVVHDYRPRLSEVEVVSDDGNRAVVNVSIPLDDQRPLDEIPDGLVVDTSNTGDDPAYEGGTLVREGGEWKVETDPHLLRIGRSVEDTVVGYVEAYNDGDCERLIDHLSQAAWSDDGEIERTEHLRRCTEEAEAREAAAAESDTELPPLPSPYQIQVTFGEGASATAAVRWGQGAPESLPLVQEGLEWRLDVPGIQMAEYLELDHLVLDEPITGFEPDLESMVFPGLRPSVDFEPSEGSDAAERRRDAGFTVGNVTRFTDGANYVTVLLYEFGTADGAGGYAQHLASRFGQSLDARVVPPPAADPYRTVVFCGDDDGCQHATEAVVLASHDHYLVGVNVTEYEGEDLTTDAILTQADQVLQAQIEQLG